MHFHKYSFHCAVQRCAKLSRLDFCCFTRESRCRQANSSGNSNNNGSANGCWALSTSAFQSNFQQEPPEKKPPANGVRAWARCCCVGRVFRHVALAVAVWVSVLGRCARRSHSARSFDHPPASAFHPVIQSASAPAAEPDPEFSRHR